MKEEDNIAASFVPRLIGTWDDHDYGENDGDMRYKDKVESQRIFLDFLDEPSNSSRRKQRGVYVSYLYGPVGKQIKVILLDNRFSQYNPKDGSEAPDMLGDDQWEWLERELLTNTAQLTIIGAGLQIVSWGKMVGEGWRMFPESRQRLFNLIANGTLISTVLRRHTSSFQFLFVCYVPIILCFTFAFQSSSIFASFPWIICRSLAENFAFILHELFEFMHRLLDSSPSNNHMIFQAIHLFQ
jgi:alkaline phosphatase D